MVAQHAVDPTLPGLEEVIDRLTKATFDAPAATPYEAEIRRAEERVLVDRVMWLATRRAERAGPRDRVLQAGEAGRAAAKPTPATSEGDQAQHTLLAADIKRFLERPAETMRVMPAPDAPPGAPIGDRRWTGSRLHPGSSLSGNRATLAVRRPAQ